MLLALLAGACAGAPTDPADFASRALEQCRDGVSAADAGRWEEAQFRWQKAIAIDDQTACAYNNLAVAAERDGRFEEAGDLYRQALDAASGAVRERVARNLDTFTEARTADEVATISEEDTPLAGRDAAGVETLSVTLDVPEAEGRDLANYERVLVGDFVVTTPDAPVPVNELAISYFRRRIVQRTFFQAVGNGSGPLDPDGDPLDDAELWAQRAEVAEADMVLTGRIGLTTENASRVVTESIRTADGQVREVARFREMNAYGVVFDYVLLRGNDGSRLLDGQLEASREFAVDQGLSAEEAFVETLEEMLPQLLDVITPQRTEQTRLLIY